MGAKELIKEAIHQSEWLKEDLGVAREQLDDLLQTLRKVYIVSLLKEKYPDIQVFSSEYGPYVYANKSIVYVCFNIKGYEFYLTTNDHAQQRVFAASNEALEIEEGNFHKALNEVYENLKTKRDEMSKRLREMDKSSIEYKELKVERNYYTRFMRKYREIWK